MGLLEERRAQHKARERNRGWGLAISGRSPIVSPMYGDRQAGRRQGAITIEPPNGRHVTLDIGSQTWDGAFDFGTDALQDLGWSSHEPLTGASTEATSPATGYYDLHLDLETSEVDDVTLTLTVDGETRWQKTGDIFLSLPLVLPVGEWRRGQTLQLSTNKPVSVSGGRVSMQLVDRQVGNVADPPLPLPDDPPTTGTRNSTSAGSIALGLPDYGGQPAEAGQTVVVHVFSMGAGQAEMLPSGTLEAFGGTVDLVGLSTAKCHSWLFSKVLDATDITAGEVGVALDDDDLSSMRVRAVALNLGPGSPTEVEAVTKGTTSAVFVEDTLDAADRAVAVMGGICRGSGSYWDTPWVARGVTDGGWTETAVNASGSALGYRVQTTEESGGSATMRAEASDDSWGGAGFCTFGVA